VVTILVLGSLGLAACGDGTTGEARTAASPAPSGSPSPSGSPAPSGVPTPAGSTQPDPDAAVSPPTSPTPRPTELSELPLPTLPRPSGPPSQPSDQVKLLRLIGTIAVLPNGCVQLTDDRRVSYGLVGPLTEGLVPGSRVSLRGRPTAGRDSSCQGSAIRVTQVSEAPAR